MAAFAFGIGQPFEEQSKLIARQTAYHGFTRQNSGEPLAQNLERSITGGVAEGIVDFLELIHVQIEQHHTAIGA